MIPDTLRIFGIKDLSAMDGEGIRLTIFTAGCSHACEMCHSKHTWDYNAGVDWAFEDLFEYIRDRKQWIDGITLSGGDPLYQLNNTIKFLEAFKKQKDLKDLNVWLYTGYLFEDIPSKIKTKVDVIVDGKFEINRPPARWRGSANQRIWRRVVGKHYEQDDKN